jgi:Raf kinase inhibitor-like YbhB/YbcL family protein
MLNKTFTTLAAATVLGASGASGGVSAFELTSPDIKPNSTIGMKHVLNIMGCTGENISPALEWKNAPAGTKSFALLVHDPDAPTGGAGWWHWLVYNIPADVTSLPQGAGKSDGSAMVKGAMQGTTDFGTPGWGGPCPPVGDKPHRYNFVLHALKVDKLDIPKGASASLVGFNVNANTIATAKLTATYGRPK